MVNQENKNAIRYQEAETISEVNEEKEKELSDYILDLKVLSKIQVSNKLSIKESHINIDDSYFQCINRYINNDSRESSIKYIEDINARIDSEIEKILNENTENSHLKDTPSNLLMNISQNLTLAIQGIRNLIITYADDNFNKSKLEIIIDKFQLKITKISEYIQIKKK